METFEFNLASVIIALGSALISVFVLFVNTRTQILSDDISKQANKLAEAANATANKALEISKLSIKGDVLPHLTIHYLPMTIDAQVFILRNLNHGKAKIDLLEPASSYAFIGIMDDELQFPMELGYQSERHFKLKLMDEIPPELQTYDFIKGIVLDSRIVISFEDELGRRYLLNLRHSGNNIFEGTPSEVTGGIV